jgi:class 3 adenylate cyclase
MGLSLSCGASRLAYSLLAVQFQVSMVVINFYGVSPHTTVLDYVGVSLLVYNTSGLALSITTSCSQACVFSACAPCLPEDFEAEFLQHRFTVPTDEDLEAPTSNPVFVYTDIQSSTALWNQSGEMMSAATELHDSILRSSLLKHHGYEITTVGDAFQVAFRTIGDAISYCLNVQLQLLVAKWPKELQDAIPATAKERYRRRVIFNGLRVRMGIHDASSQDGVLVQDVHAVTGKATYVGVSEMIAEFVGDLGSGGQILVTDRVAAWLRHHRSELSVDVFMEYVGKYTVPQINDASVNVYQILPVMLAARAHTFPMPSNEPPTGSGRPPRQRGSSGRLMHARLSSAASLPMTTPHKQPTERPLELAVAA